MTGRSLVAIVSLIAITACSGNGDQPASDESAATTDDSASGTTEAEANPATTGSSTSPTTTSPSAVATTTDPPDPDVVDLTGSVEDALAGLSSARNFAGGVESWLAAVPGQEGVLRNSRGITLFVPVDQGFSADDRDAMAADPDAAAVLIGEHLHVGALSTLEGSVTTAAGVEHAVDGAGDAQTIGGRDVIESVVTTNGVIYLISAPLPPAS